MRPRLRSAMWMFWVAMRTEQKTIGRNPLLYVNAGLLPSAFLTAIASIRPLDADAATRLVASVGLTALWAATIWTGGGVLRRERSYGTLPRSVSGVHAPLVILLGKSLGATLYSTAAILTSLAATSMLLRLPLARIDPVWLAVAIVLLMVSSTALGALIASMFLLTRNAIAWSGALTYPIFLAGGLLIPVSELPQWLHWVPASLSLRWTNSFVATLLDGTVRYSALAAILGLTVLYSLAAAIVYRSSLRAARKAATLELT